jgi:protease secretion system outer membrane protein
VATVFKPTPKLLRKALTGALIAGALLHGGAANALNLLQAYQAALKSDPAYRAAYFENESGKEYRVLGRAALLPNVGASYSNSRNVADIGSFDALGRASSQHPKYDSKSANVSLRQPLFNLDALARYKQGIAQSESSSATFTQRTQELALRVTGAYIDLLFASEQLALVQAQRDAYAEQQKVNNRLFEKGEGTKTDMLETQARLDVAEAQLLEAQDNVVNARTVLSGIVGTEVKTIDGLGGDFKFKPVQPVGFDEWRAIALQNNPELQAQTFAVEVARQEVNRGRAGHAPRVDFVASYNKAQSETINTFNQDSTVRSLGVQVNIPLYSGGAVNASTRQAVAGHERAKADLQARTDKVLTDLRKEYSAVASSVTKIEALVKAVESGQLLVKATEQSIKGGVRINLDLLNAQQQLYTSRRDLAQARYNYLLGNLRMRAAAGTLAFEDIRELDTYFR